MNVVLRGVYVAALTLAALGVQAQVPEHGHGYSGPGLQAHPGQRYDGRYSHNYVYPAHGAYVTTLPHGPVVVTHPAGNYYYAGGVWYRPYGPRYVVVGAPIGVFVPVLPAYYTTLWVSGVPYYYANDTYYTWSADQSGYQVVDPPAQVGYPPADPATPAPPMPAVPQDDLYAYPQAGQSVEQQSNDKYECHKWATGQSGFDPTQSGGGALPPDQAASARDNYQRAMSACLEGRGYSVR